MKSSDLWDLEGWVAEGQAVAVPPGFYSLFLYPPMPSHPFCSPLPRLGHPMCSSCRKPFRELSSCQCHVASEYRWGLRCPLSGVLGLLGVGAVWYCGKGVSWAFMTMTVTNFPISPSLVPTSPRRTERRNRLLLARGASHLRP